MPRGVIIKEFQRSDFDDWLSMGTTLWPEYGRRKLLQIFKGILAAKNEKVFMARGLNDEAIGFINLSSRREYVEGSERSPVGYVEGIYVKPGYRRKGVARALVKQGERWARANGCREMGSDTEVENVDSQKFHRRLGFRKANTVVHFIKELRI